MKSEQQNNLDAKEVVVINPHLWKKSGLSRLEFLNRIRGVKAIRVAEVRCNQEATTLPVFSYFPRTLESWALLERFHRLVNEADFSVFDERTEDTTIAIIISPKLATWLLNAKVTTIQLQILNWLAGWLTYHAKMPDEKLAELPRDIHDSVESIRHTHYGKRFTKEELWENGYPQRHEELLNYYQEVSKILTGAPPPEILKLRNYELNGVELKSWGLGRAPLGGWADFDFQYRYAYFREDNWESTVLRGEVDELRPGEKSQEIWEKWLHAFTLYPSRKSHLFGIVGEAVQMGFVYIFRGEELGRYKIGFTSNEDSYARRGSLQTGSAERLISVGHFRAASVKTETTVKKLFDAKRVRPDGEWFALSEVDVANLLDEEWRIRHNLF